MKIPLKLSVIVGFSIQIFVSIADSSQCESAVKTALRLVEQRNSHCNLIIDGTGDSSVFNFDDEEALVVPIITKTSNDLSKKDLTFSLCSNIVVLVGSEVGPWLNWLPVDSRIIFVVSHLDWLQDFPRLERMKNSIFSVVPDTSDEDSCAEPNMFERSEFLSSRLRKATPSAAQDVITSTGITTNFEGIDFKAVAFNFPPFSVLDPKSGRKDGYEFNIVEAIAGALRLNLRVNTPTTGGMWGWREEDGNYTGLQGDLQHDLAEIGWGNLFMTTDRMRIMDFSDWYLHDPSCFVYKRPSPYAGIFSLVFPMEGETWLFILVLIAAVNLFYLIYCAVWKDKTVTFGSLLMYEASATFKVSHELTYSLPTFTLRFFTGVFLLGMMVITAAYSGALVSFFSVEKYPSPPHTFDEIAKIVQEQDLQVQICCMHIETAMKESEMDSFKVMTQPDRLVEYVEGHMRNALIATYEGKVVYVYSKNALEILRRKTTDAVPYDQVGIMRDCFLPNRIGFGLSQNSPFRIAIDLKLAQLKQAGIIGKIIGDGHELLGRVQDSQMVDVKVEYHELELVRMQGVFQVWVVVLGVAAVVFAAEIIRGACFKEKIDYMSSVHEPLASLPTSK